MGFPLKRAGAVLLLGLLLSLLGAGRVQAQFAVLSGRVVDAGAAPLAGASVVLEDEAGAQRGTAADEAGRFRFTRLLPGTYRLAVTFVGYAPYADTLALDFAEELDLVVTLASDEAEVGEVEVTASQGTRQQGRTAGLITVRPSALARVPMPGITPDLAGYLLTLPGVVTPGDRGGQLFVRGGTPTQNLVLLDGMPVYQPFHIVGFYSAFPADILSYADVYAGGFGARYGGRLSSVIDVATRNGDKQRVGGAVSIAPFLSALRLEVPLVPGKVSFLGSARESIIERIAPGLLGEDLPFRFGDYFGKVHAYLSQTSSFTATVLHTFDEGRIRRADGLAPLTRWRNAAYGGRYTYLPPDFPVMAQLAVYLSSLTSRYRPPDAFDRTSDVEGVNADINFIYLLGDHRVDFGIFGRSNRFEYDLGRRGNRSRENITEGGVYVDTRFQVAPHLRLEPGLRIHVFSGGIGNAVEPRLRALLRPRGAASRGQFSFAWGVYHQQITGLLNQQDVTDTFIAWAPLRGASAVPSAVHLIAGWQRRFWRWFSFNIEGYRKTMSHLLFPRYDVTRRQVLVSDRVGGEARGLDLELELTAPGVYGYVGYGWARVRYEPDGTVTDPLALTEPFSPPHDRRHQVNVMGQVERGPYRLSARWQFGSGRPFTQALGFYDELAQDAPGPGYRTRPGTAMVAPGPLYEGRLPAYHRLDVSLERTFRYRLMHLTLQAGVVNAYDRGNLFDFDLFTAQRVDQLPLIPSLGLKVEVP